MKSQWVGSVLLLRVAPGPAIGPHVPERGVCVELICLSIHLSLVRENKKEIDT